MIVVGDPGLGDHNLGRLPMIAAMHHKKEIENNEYPNLPHYDKNKDILNDPIRINTVTELNDVLGRFNNIKYLAYFGHSWADTYDVLVMHYDRRLEHTVPWGALYIGSTSDPGTNLGVPRSRKYNDVATTSVTALTNYYNLNPKAQIRLFGCRGGFEQETILDPGTRIPLTGVRIFSKTIKPIPVARQLAEILSSGIEVYAYKSTGGSFFTQDQALGYGNSRKVTQAEIDEKFPGIKEGDPLWMVAAGLNRGWALFKGEKWWL